MAATRLQPIYDIAANLSRKGIRDVIVCPGSRCAPLTISFARQKDLHVRTITDERSAGFIALGIAQQPVVGRAHLHVWNGRVQLRSCRRRGVLSAHTLTDSYCGPSRRVDRPMGWTNHLATEHLRAACKRSYQLPQDYDHRDATWAIHRMVNDAINISTDGRHGPVHINVPLRELLYPAAKEEISFSKDFEKSNDWRRSPCHPRLFSSLGASSNSKKILIVGGQGRLSTNLITALNSFGRGRCCGRWRCHFQSSPTSSVVRYGDVFLSQLTAESMEELRPDLLITIASR